MNDHVKKRPQRKYANLVLFSVSLLISGIVGILVLELIIRLQFPILTLYRYSPYSDYVMEPNRSATFAKEEFDTEIRTNSHGLRDDELRMTDDIRVLLLGDSFTFGHGVEHVETFGYVLESKLGQSLQKSIDIMNAGHNGYDTRRELGFFKENAETLNPTTIMVGFVINDVFSNSGDYFFSPITLGALRNIPLRSVQSLAEYLKSPAKLLQKLGILDSVPTDSAVDHFDCLRPDSSCEAAWQETARFLGEIGEYAGHRQIPVVLVNIPVLDQIRNNPEKEAYDGRMATRKLQEIAAASGLVFVDLSDCAGLGEGSYYEKDGHWNSQGHAVAAQCIADQYDEVWISAQSR